MQHGSTSSTHAIGGTSFPVAMSERNTKVMRKLTPILVALAAMFMLVPSAFAAGTLQSVVPGGLPAHNATKAKSTFMDRVANDPSLGAKVAQATGSSSFNAGDYRSAGYHNGAPAGTVNTGASSHTGKLTNTRDTKNCNRHSRMLVLINVKTSVKLYVCIHCANPRLYSHARPKWHRFVKGTSMPYHKTASKTFKICGINTKITVTIKGTLHAKTWGKVMGSLKARLSAAFTAKVGITTSQKCPPQPTPQVVPPPAPVPSCVGFCGNIQVGQAQDQGQSQAQQQAQQQCAQAGGIWQNGSCDMSIVNCQNSGGQWNYGTNKCDHSPPDCHKDNSCPPPPDCHQTNTCPPPPDHAPQISCVWPAHIYQGGSDYVWCEASDPDGDALSVNVVGDSYGHISGTIPVNVRWDGTSCPAGVSCYRSTLWGDNVGTAHIVATVTANGKSSSADGYVPVKPDDFGS